MARTLNGNHCGRAARGFDDTEIVTDYSLKSRAYYLNEITAEEEFIRTHPEHPERFAASANISYCQECLSKLDDLADLEKLEEDEAANVDVDGFLLLMAVADCPPEPQVIGQAVAVQAGNDPLEFGTQEWFNSLPEIPF